MLYFLGDCSRILDLVVHNALEVRKPAYAGFPFRLLIVSDLIMAYLMIDLQGYADEAREALDYLASEVGIDEGEPVYRLLCARYFYAHKLDDWDSARAVCMTMLATLEREREDILLQHYRPIVHAWLCKVAFRQRDHHSLADWALLGAERVPGYQQKVLRLFWACQAFLARRAANEKEARRLYRMATARTNRLRSPPMDGYFEVLCDYHEAGGDLEQALQERDRELAFFVDKGMPMGEFLSRMERCRLLSRLGLPLGEEASAARAVAGKLRKPDKWLAEIDRLVEQRPEEAGER
jgi:hypothetical protein